MTALLTSPLFQLPLELRLPIYHFALDRDGEDLPSRKSLSLLQTCRQIYAEARLIPFSCLTVSLGPYDDYNYDTRHGLNAPGAVELLRRLLPWQRRAVSLEVLSIFPRFTANFATNWSTFRTLCNEAGLRLKELSVTACQQRSYWEEPTLEQFPFSKFSELQLHPRLKVTYRCTKSARPLPDAWVAMLEDLGTLPSADTGRERGGNVSIKVLVAVGREVGYQQRRFLLAKGMTAEYPAWRSRYVQLVPEFQALPTDW